MHRHGLLRISTIQPVLSRCRRMEEYRKAGASSCFHRNSKIEPTLLTFVDACMNMIDMTASIAEACKSMVTFTGERPDGERMLMCNVISEGLKLQELCREFENSPEPKDCSATHTRTMAAFSAYTDAFEALSRSGHVQELSAGQVAGPKPWFLWPCSRKPAKISSGSARHGLHHMRSSKCT